MATEVQQIVEKLSHIQADVDFIKRHITDIDIVLTDDDVQALGDAESDLKEGKTKRLI